jgi:hypothetical protein
MASGVAPKVTSWKRGTAARRSSSSPTVTVRGPMRAATAARRVCSAGSAAEARASTSHAALATASAARSLTRFIALK